MIREVGSEHLKNVVTLGEARRAWGKSRSALIYAIDRGHLTARKAGRDWLITVPSLIIRYGNPIQPLDPK